MTPHPDPFPRTTGKVYLIGAGPGDPELLTLKAVRVLGMCDVLLVDDLVDPAVLSHAQPDVRIVRVGKRGGCRSTPQAFIERLMRRCARAGLTVGRVKGGDPFVFGRGGEEKQAMERAGIACEVVSGLSSGIAVPASLGVPVTHRDLACGVTFVTGHARADGQPGREPDWAALARCGTTLVIYMGMRTLDSITRALIDGGLPTGTPACAIQNGTRGDQRSVLASVATLAREVSAAGLGSPAIVVIGEVVRLAGASSQLDLPHASTQMAG
ncbi:uroporphyrinogen-III C-methyltransferase [Methyloversatilis sp. XJ19-49]|uniref:uroporphyrinogen-III C-methyltransferase n=1 Tax=Methyloversatilis sp. XJ19-49 TaxID=2963429 RepID=UPI00211CC36B|nr:uroporphyrinogen-III C-methyltransferase [Methyloversatilis sp. XJ19-49]MCQ9379385.1 uroporphyrinogen-III C-methyltransferase [Methyloversatilis sp. XJ19-49]